MSCLLVRLVKFSYFMVLAHEIRHKREQPRKKIIVSKVDLLFDFLPYPHEFELGFRKKQFVIPQLCLSDMEFQNQRYQIWLTFFESKYLGFLNPKLQLNIKKSSFIFELAWENRNCNILHNYLYSRNLYGHWILYLFLKSLYTEGPRY